MINAKPFESLIEKRFVLSMYCKQTFIKECQHELIRLAHACKTSIKAGGKILIFGNGGSETDALHFCGEMLGKLKDPRTPYPCIALTFPSANTAIANDYGYEQIFSRQVKALCKKEDIVIGISTSGNSKNVIYGITTAMECGATRVGFTGGNGGELGKMVNFHINVSQAIDAASAQEVHIFALHLLAQMIEDIN